MQDDRKRDMPSDPCILLTGTIVPNAEFTKHADVLTRKKAYLECIDYYSKFGRVHFLENSSYDLTSDEDFSKRNNFELHKFPLSSCPSKGKGFQEFEMLDAWFRKMSSTEMRWIKITGRYKVENFQKIFISCSNERSMEAFFEQKLPPSTVARTDIFYVTKNFYEKYLLDAYYDSDDGAGVYIEHVIRKRIADAHSVETFPVFPVVSGVSGSTNKKLSPSSFENLKYFIRNSTRIFDSKYRII